MFRASGLVFWTSGLKLLVSRFVFGCLDLFGFVFRVSELIFWVCTRTDARTERRMGGWADGQTGGRADGQTRGQADRRTGGQADGRANGSGRAGRDGRDGRFGMGSRKINFFRKRIF